MSFAVKGLCTSEQTMPATAAEGVPLDRIGRARVAWLMASWLAIQFRIPRCMALPSGLSHEPSRVVAMSQ
jgi:hypothetical protein